MDTPQLTKSTNSSTTNLPEKVSVQNTNDTKNKEDRNIEMKNEEMKSNESLNNDLKEFPFEFRQTKKCIPIIIQVPNIASSSVSISYGTRVVSMKFCTSAATNTSDGTKGTVTEVWYGMSFMLMGDINVEECRYDVATSNMVVVLVKQPEEYWIQEDDIPVIQSKPYIHINISKNIVIEEKEISTLKEEKEVNNVSVVNKIDASSSSAVKENRKQHTPINTQFKSHASGVLFELD